MCIYFLYPNIQLYFSQHFEYSSDVPLLISLLYCAFQNFCLHATLLHLSLYRACYHSLIPLWFFFSVLHSGHRISFFSCFSTLSPIAFFLPHFIYYTLVISLFLAFSSLQFHTFWQRLYHIFFTCLLRRNSCF